MRPRLQEAELSLWPRELDKGAQQAARRGRPSNVTRSEKRKLARLYLGTRLLTPQIRNILKRFTGKEIS